MAGKIQGAILMTFDDFAALKDASWKLGAKSSASVRLSFRPKAY
jgi:hypothetical protein